MPLNVQVAVEKIHAGADGRFVRRLVLISGGRDGAGLPLHTVPDPVRSRANEGLTASALGVGLDYDESFMTNVADAGRGNYAFLERGAELYAFLGKELDQATRTVVDGVVAELTLPEGFRLVRALGVEHEGSTGTVRLPVGALLLLITTLGKARRMISTAREGGAD